MTKTALAGLLAVALAACASDPDPTKFEGTWRLTYSGQPCFPGERVETIVVEVAEGPWGYYDVVAAWNGARPMSSRTVTIRDGYAIDLVGVDGQMLSISLALVDPPTAMVEWSLGSDQQGCKIGRLAAFVIKTSD